MSAEALGIDLGTTNSAVAVVGEAGKAEIIPNREGERTTPSVLLFDGDEPMVGTIAKRSAVASPEDAVQFVKRHMGDPAWRFSTTGGEVWGPEQLSAAILKRLKDDAEHETGRTFSKAVVTVPAYFGDAQRKATQDAGQIAGLEVLRIINEPTAAALAFDAATDESGTIFVYDLGGGTFDVTVMRAVEGELKVLATDGDRNLGGFEWDAELMGLLNDRFVSDGGADLIEDAALQQDLREKAELAKHTLSTREQANVVLSAAGVTSQVSVTREEFEAATKELLRRTEVLTTGVVEDAGLTWDQIDRVLLVGGSTRMPAVEDLVERVSGSKPERGVNPDEIVALGAAIFAAQLEPGEEGDGAEVSVIDVNSHSMGILALNEQHLQRNTIVLPRNRSIPTQESEVFYTSRDNQTELRVEVTEGEDDDPAYVQIVGEAVMPIDPHPKETPLEVTFSYDEDGVVHVAVKDLINGKELGDLLIERTANLSADEIVAKRDQLAKKEVA